ncbi:lysozyme inhibitor LprI family protein [Methylotuvimicrobium buryatense]|uniref:lysozyme inhibitor LprI family protein n=1 Tax=Methylotuvimicrobium buryatense TaxID=95641 RepID=UPI00163EEE70|nr:lysozyme inhibitor LprI family protein [Methylotuvimicrobium buryatense]
MQKVILTTGLIFSAFAWSAPSECETEPHPIDVKYEACMENTNDYPAMMNCVEIANSEWQKEMSVIYGKLESRLQPKDHSTLEKAQKAWQAYHDAEFALYNAMQAGEEVDTFMFAEKKMRVIGDRAKELQNFSDYVLLADAEK